MSRSRLHSPAYDWGDFGVVFPHSDDALTILMCDVSGMALVRRSWPTAFTRNTASARTKGRSDITVARPRLVHDRIATDGFYHHGRKPVGRPPRTLAAAAHPPAMLVSSGGVRLLSRKTDPRLPGGNRINRVRGRN
jgi:hypothetical protein